MSEWEQFKAYAGIIADAKNEERERIIAVIEQQSHHYAKTHYKGINCMICRIYSQIGYEY